MATKWGLKVKELNRFHRALEDFSKKEFAIINGMALNQTAFEGMIKAKQTVERRFILRNKFALGSIRMQKVKGFTNQFSEMGSIAPFMEDQEFGKTKTKTGKRGVDVPTRAASGESRGSSPRKRVMRRPLQRGRIRLYKRTIKTKNRKQWNAIVIKQAAKASGRKFVFLRLQRSPGIYMISGGKKNPKIDLIHDLSRKTVRIPKKKWLEPAVNNVRRKMPLFYEKAFRLRLKKNASLQSLR